MQTTVQATTFSAHSSRISASAARFPPASIAQKNLAYKTFDPNCNASQPRQSAPITGSFLQIALPLLLLAALFSGAVYALAANRTKRHHAPPTAPISAEIDQSPDSKPSR